MKNKYEEKIRELEKRIAELEKRPQVNPVFPPIVYPPYSPVPFPTCWCGRNFPHTCTWC